VATRSALSDKFDKERSTLLFCRKLTAELSTEEMVHGNTERFV
jgi:hypothetical protein